MSVLYAIILGMTENWFKYDYVCSVCDALIEITNKSNIYKPHTCCGKEATWLSVVDVTIEPTRKEGKQMEQNELTQAEQEQITLATQYNPTQIVIYKEIANGDPVTTKYICEKVTDVESALAQSRRNYKTLTEKQNAWYKKESQLRTLLEEVYADSEEQEVLAQIAEIFDVPLTKEIEVTAWVRVDMTVEVDLTTDLDNLEDFISSNLTVDSYGSEIQVSNYEVERVEEGAY